MSKYFEATIKVLIETDTDAEASDAISETLRPVLRVNEPESCIIDWTYAPGGDPAPHNGEGYEYAEPRYTKWWVTVYLCDRAFGGPEEGGWYYDTGEPTTDYAMSFERDDPEEARALADSYAQWLDTMVVRGMNRGRRPISSVLSTGRYQALVEAHPPQAYPQQRPRYE